MEEILNNSDSQDGAAMGVADVDTKEGPMSISIPDIADLPESEESYWRILAQVVIPFFMAGMGMVSAGLYLSHIQTWPVFKNVPEIIILVPSLLGLKGNLEMTLASRLSTEANMGRMDDHRQRYSMISANVVLVQCQALVVALLSSVVAIIMVLGVKWEFNFTHSLLLCACSLITASIASFFLSIATSIVICVSRYFNINPDNVATPLAASLGDITSLVLLSYVASILYELVAEANNLWISPLLMALCIAFIPIFFCLAWRNEYTRPVLTSGWTPVIVAMIISTFGGMILDKLVTTFHGLAVYQPVINGVGGNLVSVQASRLSTDLHKKTELGKLPPETKILIGPHAAFFNKGGFSTTARVLMSLVIPGHLVFIGSIHFFEETDLTVAFTVCYLIVSVLQVGILIYFSHILTHWFWSRNTDPDNSTIPYLTALGDFLGIVLLGLLFKFLAMVE